MAGDGRRLPRAAIAALIVAAAIGAPAPLRAQGDAFTVSGVAVDVTAENAAAARAKAIADAQRRALQRVFGRVTLSEDAKRLPQVNERTLETFVQALEVDKERSSAVRYLAELTVRFKADAIRELLRQAGIPFAETRGRPVLILPVYQDGPNAMLWEDTNPWRAAWAAVPTEDALLAMIVPIGDLIDADTIDAAAALSGDAQKLGAIAARYRAGEVVVATAKLIDAPSGSDALEIAVARHGATTQTSSAGAPIPVDSAGALEKRLAAIARDMARRMDDDWKRANVTSFDQQQRMTMSLPLNELSELVEARRRLSELPSVQRVEVTAVTRKLARLAVTYNGGPQQLQAAVAQKEMTLTQSQPDWELTLSRAGRAPPRAAPPDQEPQKKTQ